MTQIISKTKYLLLFLPILLLGINHSQAASISQSYYSTSIQVPVSGSISQGFGLESNLPFKRITSVTLRLAQPSSHQNFLVSVFECVTDNPCGGTPLAQFGWNYMVNGELALFPNSADYSWTSFNIAPPQYVGSIVLTSPNKYLYFSVTGDNLRVFGSASESYAAGDCWRNSGSCGTPVDLYFNLTGDDQVSTNEINNGNGNDYITLANPSNGVTISSWSGGGSNEYILFDGTCSNYRYSNDLTSSNANDILITLANVESKISYQQTVLCHSDRTFSGSFKSQPDGTNVNGFVHIFNGNWQMSAIPNHLSISITNLFTVNISSNPSTVPITQSCSKNSNPNDPSNCGNLDCSQYDSTFSTAGVGCYLSRAFNNTMTFLFVPTSYSTSVFANTLGKLKTDFPFVMYFGMADIVQKDLVDQSPATLTWSTTTPIAFTWVLLSPTMIQDSLGSDFNDIYMGILTALIWLIVVYLIWHKFVSMHNQ